MRTEAKRTKDGITICMTKDLSGKPEKFTLSVSTRKEMLATHDLSMCEFAQLIMAVGSVVLQNPNIACVSNRGDVKNQAYVIPHYISISAPSRICDESIGYATMEGLRDYLSPVMSNLDWIDLNRSIFIRFDKHMEPGYSPYTTIESDYYYLQLRSSDKIAYAKSELAGFLLDCLDMVSIREFRTDNDDICSPYGYLYDDEFTSGTQSVHLVTQQLDDYYGVFYPCVKFPFDDIIDIADELLELIDGQVETK